MLHCQNHRILSPKRVLQLPLIIMVCSGCAGTFSSDKMITLPRYQEMQVGQTVQELFAKYGKPYDKRMTKDGSEEYIYIETILVGRNKTLMREYIFQVENGRVIAKKMVETQPSAFEFISD